MTDNNEQLLRDFLRPMAEMELKDDGFTERVMQRLPEQDLRSFRLSHLWTLFCVAVFVVLFFMLNGWEAIKTGFEVFLRTAPVEFNPMVPLAIVAGLLIATATELGYSSRRLI